MKQASSWLLAAFALSACGCSKKMCDSKPLEGEWRQYADVIDGKDRVVCARTGGGQKVYFKGMSKDAAFTAVLRGFEGKPEWTIVNVDRERKMADHRHTDGTLMIVVVDVNDNGTQAMFETRKRPEFTTPRRRGPSTRD